MTYLAEAPLAAVFLPAVEGAGLPENEYMDEWMT